MVIAVLFFGSNFVPVKKFDTGDGEREHWYREPGLLGGGERQEGGEREEWREEGKDRE